MDENYVKINQVEQNDMEIWKEINGHEDYQASNRGRVRSLKHGGKKILKPNFNSNGYLSVSLSNGKVKTYAVHKLVAIAFLDHKPCGHDLVVDHRDANKENNKLENLQLITNRENCSKDKFNVGANWHKGNKKWQSQIQINGKLLNLGYFNTAEEAHQAYQEKTKTLEQ